MRGAQNLVKRDVRLEHLRKIETVKPGTFGFTKKKNKRDAIINAIDTNHRSEGSSFVDPESVRLEILEERTIGLDDGDKVEEVKDDGDNNIEKGDKRRAISDKERERAREVDFHSRLMRLCDEAHVAFCKKHGISISPSSNVPNKRYGTKRSTSKLRRQISSSVPCAMLLYYHRPGSLRRRQRRRPRRRRCCSTRPNHRPRRLPRFHSRRWLRRQLRRRLRRRQRRR